MADTRKKEYDKEIISNGIRNRKIAEAVEMSKQKVEKCLDNLND